MYTHAHIHTHAYTIHISFWQGYKVASDEFMRMSTTPPGFPMFYPLVGNDAVHLYK